MSLNPYESPVPDEPIGRSWTDILLGWCVLVFLVVLLFPFYPIAIVLDYYYNKSLEGLPFLLIWVLDVALVVAFFTGYI